MIVTEDRAKEMLCPERCYGQIAVNCVGMSCMWWRVYDRVTVGDKVVSRTVERGYCGHGGPVKGKWFKARDVR